MGVYINPKYLAWFSEPHKAEIKSTFWLDRTTWESSIPLRVLNIILHGKAKLLPSGSLPRKVTLEEVSDFFPNIPLEIAQKQFSKADFLLYRFSLLSKGIYRGSIEDLLRELRQREIAPNLHILHQILARCNSLTECMAILESEQLTHLKGTYNEYIIGVVLKKCVNHSQKCWVRHYFREFWQSVSKGNMPKQESNNPQAPVTSETPPRQQTVAPVTPVPVSLSAQEDIAFGRKGNQSSTDATPYIWRRRNAPRPPKPVAKKTIPKTGISVKKSAKKK